MWPSVYLHEDVRRRYNIGVSNDISNIQGRVSLSQATGNENRTSFADMLSRAVLQSHNKIAVNGMTQPIHSGMLIAAAKHIVCHHLW